MQFYNNITVYRLLFVVPLPQLTNHLKLNALIKDLQSSHQLRAINESGAKSQGHSSDETGIKLIW